MWHSRRLFQVLVQVLYSRQCVKSVVVLQDKVAFLFRGELCSVLSGDEQRSLLAAPISSSTFFEELARFRVQNGAKSTP